MDDKSKCSGEPVAEVYSHESRDMMRVRTKHVRFFRAVPDGTKLYAAPQPTEPVKKTHTDDDAVDHFATAMKEKLAQARKKGRSGWHECDPADLSAMLREHVEKGDPLDVANFCMFLWSLGHPISAAEPVVKDSLTVAEPVKLKCSKCGADRTKEPCAGNLMDCEFKGVAHAAEPDTCPLFKDVEARNSEPVKVPSDAQPLLDMIDTLCTGLEWNIENHPGVMNESDAEALQEARALLARYGESHIGRPAQPAASAEPTLWIQSNHITCAQRMGPFMARVSGRKEDSDWLPLYTTPVAAQPSVPWDNFPGYLIDHCEGDIITEEGLQHALSSMLRDPQYNAPTPPADAQDNIIITENGGVQLNTHNPEVANKLFALIDQFRSARPSCSQGDMTALKTAEAYNAEIPVTEQEEEEWKRLEDRK